MSNQTEAPTSRVARTAAALAAGSLATASVGILGVQIGLLPPLVGFYLFALGAVLGALLDSRKKAREKR